MLSTVKEKIKEYMAKPYKMQITKVPEDDGGGFIVDVPDLGSMSTRAWGETVPEAMDALKEIMEHNFETWLNEGYDIPEPDDTEEKYSGRISFRTTSYAHKCIMEMAKQEHISANQFLNNIVYQAIGLMKSVVEPRIEYRILSLPAPRIDEEYNAFNAFDGFKGHPCDLDSQEQEAS